MAVSMLKLDFRQSLARAGYLLITIPIGLVILIAVWLTAAAAYENVKFAHATDQLIFLIETARHDAATDTNFGRGTGEDLIDDLIRRSQLPGPPANSWNGQLRAQVPILPFMRIETDVPVHACRRLANFFGKDAGALELQKLEARQEKGEWLAIYDANDNKRGLDYRLVNAACGGGSYATIALTLRLR